MLEELIARAHAADLDRAVQHHVYVAEVRRFLDGSAPPPHRWEQIRSRLTRVQIDGGATLDQLGAR